MLLLASLLLACSDPAPAPTAPAPPGPPGPPQAEGPQGPPPPGTPGPPGGGQRSPFHADVTMELTGTVDAAPRSVLIVSLDTVRADRLAVYGGRAETPQLSALATAGARFDQAMSHYPETCLSHWAMLTGVQPEAHGNAPAVAGSRYRGPTVAAVAAAHGYATGGFIGGVTMTDIACGMGRDFAHYDDHFAVDRADMRRPAADVTAAAVDWIQAQDGPWLALVHYFDAHFPYTPEAPWDTRYDPDYDGTIDGTDASLDRYRRGDADPSPRDLAHVLALYDGELSELDGHLAPLLAAAGPDTVVLVTSDHGESFEHGYWFNHRASLHDGVMHVPLILRGPGVPAGATVDAQVGLIDVAPTVLDLAGLPLDTRMEGESLVPLLGGGDGGRDEVHAVTDPWRADARFAARTPTHKLIEGPPAGAETAADAAARAFDLVADPGETTALATVPEALRDARTRYRAALAPALDHQAPAPAVQTLSPEEQARLEALGYLPPEGADGTGGPGGGPGAGGPEGPPPPPGG